MISEKAYEIIRISLFVKQETMITQRQQAAISSVSFANAELLQV
ncbi:hypothetical protein NIES2107_72450 (plasmid) [Nostoc carneum NIES-2107]|nr:hypothetical protein NIES2107_72450 [Nostoc carneum NIES-2107]